MIQHNFRNAWQLAAVALLAAAAGCPADATNDGGSGSTNTNPTNTAGNNADAGSGSGVTADLEGEIEIDGSSTVKPISEYIAGEFMKRYPKVKVTVGISGTGGGFERFHKGETDISDASRPIKDTEFELCRENKIDFIEIPVAYDGLSIVVNPKNDFVKELTIDQLKKIFLAPGAKTWQDVDSAWPAETIKIYAPGKQSGTYDYFFGDVVNKDKKGQVRSEGVSFNEDDNPLVDGVARETNAIGFFGFAYYVANKHKLKEVPIVNPETGKAVSATHETIETGEYAPFSRPLFIYLNVKSLESPAMKKFVEYYLSNAAKASESVGYVSLPKAIYAKASSHYQNRLTGTHYMTEDLEKRHGALAAVYVEENLVKVVE